MQREFLKNLGLSDEAIDKVMAENGKDVNDIKTQLNTAESERESYKSQVEERDTQISQLKTNNTDNAELQKQLTDLQSQIQTKDSDATQQLSAAKKEFAVKLALKDSGTVNSDILFDQVNMDNVIIQDDGKISGLDDQVATFKESMPYLFQSTEEPAKPKIVAGGNPSTTTPATYDLSKMSYKEVAKLKAEQPEVFEQLTK
ncbi:scaffold protein [Lactococcus lactis RTB018]|nr:phage scaffolding protein [Lactococcus lactis]OAZ15921.1 scaffold protein [Lactococcus lactis RTB018]